MRRGLVTLAQPLPGITARAFGGKGGALGTLLLHWRDIVGDGPAARARPVRLSGRGRTGLTLHLSASGGDALLIQHDTASMIEAINTYFGQPVVQAIRLSQAGGLPARQRPAKPLPNRKRAIGPAEAERLEALVQRISDPSLRAAMLDLGRAVAESDGEEADG